MRYDVVKCDRPGCEETHQARFGDGHPGWGQLIGVGWTDPETGQVLAHEVWLCPLDKREAAAAGLGTPLEG